MTTPSKHDENAHDQTDEAEEDDYMSMTFATPTEPKVETSMQRRARKQREAELKARPRSKAEIAAEESAAREAALATSLDSSNKGFRMMAKLGFKGGALGKGGVEGRTEPIRVEMKEDRSGIGLESEKKRKFREEAALLEVEAKKAKEDEGGYRERMRRERELKRLEGQIIGAMIVAERLNDESEQREESDRTEAETADESPSNRRGPRMKSKPLSAINLLWRGLVKHRLEKERERRIKHDLQQSLSRMPAYADPGEDEQDRQAFGNEEEELEEEDPDLDQFNSLEPEVRLAKIVEYLRVAFHYCFWCKHQYGDPTREGCPGLTEDDHD